MNKSLKNFLIFLAAVIVVGLVDSAIGINLNEKPWWIHLTHIAMYIFLGSLATELINRTKK